MPAPVAHLTVIEADEHTVLCEGIFATANGAGTHSMLRPRLFLSEIGLTADEKIKVGDVVVQMDDGTYQHQPTP